MKNRTFTFVLVSLSLTVAASAAVQNNTSDREIVVLPDFKVSADRYTAAEKSIETSLAEFRAQAATVDLLRPELPALGSVAKQAQPDGGRRVAAKPVRLTPTRS
jgi:hypothetical protein